MKDKPNDLLLLAGQVLAALMQIFMAIAAAALVIALPAILFLRDTINAEIAGEAGKAASGLPVMPLVGVLAFALVIVALVFVFFGRLRAIIASVGEGDPFVPENAARLNLMAWLLLSVQVLVVPLAGFGLMLAKWADQFENQNITIDAGFDLTGILMVIILFILARVFKHGAAMREDLEGTV
ncbi:MAG TPA: DUF2975 domain-containing protein [Alphaproteobacteria bacterium]|jgi:hypothetical protein|nr:DUF2975 domain-containing protein [Alphaproteobacteria bacterium]